MSEAEEERWEITEAIRVHTEATGTAARSAGTPGVPRSITLRLLMEAGGFRYLCDAYGDDLPYWIKTPSSEPHLIIPYTLDANDMRFGQPAGVLAAGDQFFTYLKDSFDVLYAEGARRRRR